MEIFSKKVREEDAVHLTGSIDATAAAIGGRTIHKVINYERRKRRRLGDVENSLIQRKEPIKEKKSFQEHYY